MNINIVPSGLGNHRDSNKSQFHYSQANAQNIINPIVNNPFPNIASSINSGSQFSPWFPSVPAIACGGLFSLTITGKPHINVNVHGSSNNNKDLLALQVTSTPPPLSNGVTSFLKFTEDFTRKEEYRA